MICAQCGTSIEDHPDRDVSYGDYMKVEPYCPEPVG